MNLNKFSKIKTMSVGAFLFALLISTTASADEKSALANSANHMAATPEMKKDMANVPYRRHANTKVRLKIWLDLHSHAGSKHFS